MDFDLQRGLRDLNNAPRFDGDVVELDRVIRRVHRGRAVRTAAVGVTSAAAVVALAATVQAVGFRGDAAPPAVTQSAGPTPSVEPTPSLQPTPTPAPPPSTAEPTVAPPAVVETPNIVALTVDGELVLLDAATGERVALIRDGFTPLRDGVAPRGHLALTPDRRHAFVSEPPADGGENTIVRVSLEDGSRQDVAFGYSPAVSPDGRTLAYIGSDAGADPLGDPSTESRGVYLLDLTTGEAREIRDPACVACDRVLGSLAWSPDGSSIVLEAGASELTQWIDVVVVDVTATSLDEARILLPASADGEGAASWHLPTFMADGRLAASRTVQLDDYADLERVGSIIRSSVVIVDPASGQVLEEFALAPSSTLSSLAAGPDGEGFVTVTFDVLIDDRWTSTLQRFGDDGSPGITVEGIVSADW